MCLCKLVMTHDSLLIVRFVFFQPWLLWVFLFYASPVLRFNLQSANKRCGLPLALPLHAKKLYQGLPLPGGEKEAQACRAGGGFFPHSKVL